MAPKPRSVLAWLTLVCATLCHAGPSPTFEPLPPIQAADAAPTASPQVARLIDKARAARELAIQRRLLNEAVAMARKVRDDAGLAEASTELAMTYRMADPRRALDLLESTRPILVRLKLDDRLFANWIDTADCLSRLGDWTNAMKAVDAVADLAKASGDPHKASFAAHVRGAILVFKHDYAAAIPLLQEAAAAREKAGEKEYLLDSYNCLGIALSESGRLLEGMAFFEKERQLASELKRPFDVLRAQRALAVMASRMNRSQEAYDAFADILQQRRKLNDELGLAEALLDLAIASGTVGHVDESLGLYKEAADFASHVGDVIRERMAWAYRASLSLSKGLIDEGRSSYETAIQVALKHGEWAAAADLLNALGDHFINSKLWDRARLCHRKALALREKIGDKLNAGWSVFNIGRSYHDEQKYETALTYYARSLKVGEELGDARLTSQSHHNIGNTQLGLGNTVQSVLSLRRAYEIRIKGTDVEGQFWSMNQMALANQMGRNYEASRAQYSQALTLARKLKNPQHEAASEFGLGQAFSELGLGDSALRHYEAALGIYESQGMTVEASFACNNMGLIYDKRLDIDHAESYFRRGVDYGAKTDDWLQIALCLSNLGHAFHRAGLPDRAMPTFKHVLSLRHIMGDRDGEVDALSYLTSINTDIGLFPEAMALADQLLAVSKESRDPLHESTGSSLKGVIYFKMGDYASAARCYERDLQIAKNVNRPDLVADALAEIASVHVATGDLEGAQKLFQQALPLAQEKTSRFTLRQCFEGLGRIALDQGRLDEAIDFFSRSLAIDEQTNDIGRTGFSCFYLGNAYERRGDAGTAILCYKQAVNIAQHFRRSISAIGGRELESVTRIVEAGYRQLAALLLKEGRYLEAEQVMAMLRESEQFSFVRRSEAADDFNRRIELYGKETAWWAEWTKTQGKIGQILVELEALRLKKTKSPAEKVRLIELEASENAIRSRTELLLAEIQKVIQADKDLIARDAAEKLLSLEKVSRIDSVLFQLKADGDNVAAVYTVVTNDLLHVIFVGSEGPVPLTVEVSEQELGATVAEFRQAVSDPALDPRPSGRKLYDWLVKPVMELAGDRPIIWSLDGPLQYVPLGALWDGQHYLAERTPDIRFSLLSLEVVVNQRHNLMLDAFACSTEAPGFDALPGAAIEAESVAKSLSGDVYKNDEFTESTLKNVLNTRHGTVLHLATHFRLGKESKLSALLLGQRDQKPAGPWVPADGSQTSRELSLAEMSSWGSSIFSHLDLLVLSACSTGLDFSRLGPTTQDKPLDGREFGSLAAFALQKGTQSVLASLWDVNDESTTAFMMEFYRQWNTGKRTKREALQEAQKAMISGRLVHDPAYPEFERGPKRAGGQSTIPAYQPAEGEGPWAHPYYWAPFVLTGNWK